MHVSKEQILVVDDEEELRASIVEILTLDGFEVEQANSAEVAAEKLSQTLQTGRTADHGSKRPQRAAASVRKPISEETAE